jgi:hypothetical protein
LTSKTRSRIDKSYSTCKENTLGIIRWKSSRRIDDELGRIESIYESSRVGLSMDEELTQEKSEI